MKNPILKLRNLILRLCYKYLIKPFFFRMEPENIHDKMISCGYFLGRSNIGRKVTEVFFNYENQILNQIINNLDFTNPIGLAAGFDKNGYLVNILPEVGFGFMEIGSVTGQPCAGNPRPRLWRLPQIKSLVVNYGLANEGAEAVGRRLYGNKTSIPLGISLAKANCAATVDPDAAVADYLKAYRHTRKVADYITVNISCPNAFGGQPFTDAELLKNLLAELMKQNPVQPIFIKMSPDLNHEQLNSIIQVATQYKITGFICTNLTKNRRLPIFNNVKFPGNGGTSGQSVKDLSTAMIKYVYQLTEGKFIIIGCGGIASATDAYEKIKAGASLLQLITGMIYNGPQLISEINFGLAEKLRQEGFQNISEAIGSSS